MAWLTQVASCSDHLKVSDLTQKLFVRRCKRDLRTDIILRDAYIKTRCSINAIFESSWTLMILSFVQLLRFTQHLLVCEHVLEASVLYSKSFQELLLAKRLRNFRRLTDETKVKTTLCTLFGFFFFFFKHGLQIDSEQLTHENSAVYLCQSWSRKFFCQRSITTQASRRLVYLSSRVTQICSFEIWKN